MQHKMKHEDNCDFLLCKKESISAFHISVTHHLTKSVSEQKASEERLES